MVAKLVVGVGVLALALGFALFGLDFDDVGAVDGPVLALPEFDSAMAAEISGVLAFDVETSCLLLQIGLKSYPLVWPAGTSWAEDIPAVELATGELLKPGAEFTAGGGFLRRERVKSMAGFDVANRAAACAGSTGEIAVVQAEILAS